MSQQTEYDVVVIGGGPAGATAATVLAQHGRHVILLEKEKFPRYCIGESMMPYCYFPLERIGMIDRLNESRFVKKYSVQFISQSGRVSQPFYFFQHFDHPAAQTWQVLRSEFDQMLLDNAREKGVEVLEETRAKEVLRDERGYVVGVRAESKERGPLEFRAPMTIDASGRDALTAARNGWRIMDKHLRKIALWTYYRGAMRDSGLDEGATTVAYVPEKGWFWYIPLPDDIVGVGIVAEKDYLYSDTRDPEAIFLREVEKNPWVKEHLSCGRNGRRPERVPPPGVPPSPDGKLFLVTGEFSYRSKHCAANGLVLVGDAFAFLDPVFSSGLFLALWSGEKAGDAVHHALLTGDVSAAQFCEYGAQLCHGLEAMRKLVYAFYDHDFNFRTFHTTYPHLRGDLTDCLIGHLFRDFTELFLRIGEFTKLPEPVLHGQPQM